MTTSIRMSYRNRQDTLHGYIFADEGHARKWLSQRFVDRSEISLELVECSELRRCPRCNGEGITQSVKAIRKLTVDEFLAPTPDAGA